MRSCPDLGEGPGRPPFHLILKKEEKPAGQVKQNLLPPSVHGQWICH